VSDQTVESPPLDGQGHFWQRIRSGRRALGVAPIWYSTIGLFALSWILEPRSVSHTALDAMLPFASILAVAAVGETLVVMTRGLDMSIGTTMTLAALVASRYASEHGDNLALSILVVAVMACVVGALNGVLVTFLRITPLVATLAMSTVLSAVALTYSGGHPVRAPASLARFALSKTLGLSNTLLMALAVVVLVSLVASRTVWGRRLQAVGSSERSAVMSGIHANRLIVSGYIGAALCVSAAGVLMAGYVSTPNVTSGNRYLLSAVAAVVIGGTSFAGGKGRIVGTAVGALFLSQLSQLVLSLGLPTSAQILIEAGVIGVAVSTHGLSFRRLKSALQRWRRTPIVAVDPLAGGQTSTR
jgi:ribose transport system permease protein